MWGLSKFSQLLLFMGFTISPLASIPSIISFIFVLAAALPCFVTRYSRCMNLLRTNLKIAVWLIVSICLILMLAILNDGDFIKPIKNSISAAFLVISGAVCSIGLGSQRLATAVGCSLIIVFALFFPSISMFSEFQALPFGVARTNLGGWFCLGVLFWMALCKGRWMSLHFATLFFMLGLGARSAFVAMFAKFYDAKRVGIIFLFCGLLGLFYFAVWIPELLDVLRIGKFLHLYEEARLFDF